jgi:NAD(P)-dependent dehydrogenase (short-subunit alcohol dehydrogenase family)
MSSVNIGGGAAVGSIADAPLEELEARIATDLWGPIHVTRAALPVMRAQGAGYIVQASVVDGRRSSPSRSQYPAATWGLAGFSEALAAELAPLGIRVTIVEVGGLPTDPMDALIGDPARAPRRSCAWSPRSTPRCGCRSAPMP